MTKFVEPNGKKPSEVSGRTFRTRCSNSIGKKIGAPPTRIVRLFQPGSTQFRPQTAPKRCSLLTQAELKKLHEIKRTFGSRITK